MVFKRNPRKSSYQKGGPIFNQDAYKSFGPEAHNAFQEGWMPQSSPQSGATIFYNRYALLNSVNIPNDSRKGHLAMIGHDNGLFDIATQDASGKQFGEYIMRNSPYQQAHDYFTNNGSVIKQRADNIIKGTNEQADGSLIAGLKEGGIQINPKNKGKFTQYKKRTGKTTQEALHSDDPHVRKMAQFALNASHWKK
jgi:hypothetical protein